MCNCFGGTEIEIQELPRRYAGEPRRTRLSFVKDRPTSDEVILHQRASSGRVHRDDLPPLVEVRSPREPWNDGRRDDYAWQQQTYNEQYQPPAQPWYPAAGDTYNYPPQNDQPANYTQSHYPAAQNFQSWQNPPPLSNFQSQHNIPPPRDYRPLSPPIRQPMITYPHPPPDHDRGGHELIDLGDTRSNHYGSVQVIGEPTPTVTRRPQSKRGRQVIVVPERRGRRAREQSYYEDSDDDSWISWEPRSVYSDDSWTEVYRPRKPPHRRSGSRPSRYRN